MTTIKVTSHKGQHVALDSMYASHCKHYGYVYVKVGVWTDVQVSKLEAVITTQYQHLRVVCEQVLVYSWSPEREQEADTAQWEEK